MDRKKDMAIVGGYNVYPREIDEVLYEHPKVAEAVAVGVPHRSRGEALKAYVVPKPGETLTVAELVAHCREKLANYKVPKFFEFREELPKTLVGKVLRRVLRDEEARKLRAEDAAASGPTAMDALRERAGELVDQARERADALKEQAGELMEQAKEQAEDMLVQAKEKAGELVEQARGQAGEVSKTLGGTVDKALRGIRGEQHAPSAPEPTPPAATPEAPVASRPETDGTPPRQQR